MKDFLHECGGHRDHHYVPPVLTKGPHHDHPHIPKRKYFSRKSPSMKQCKHVFDSSYLLTHCTSIRQNFLLHCITFCKWLPNKPTHLFFSISLKRRKTLPLRSFSLLTGSKDRLDRINSFSLKNSIISLTSNEITTNAKKVSSLELLLPLERLLDAPLVGQSRE